jgi:multidrug efflux pump subunit AcrB
MMGLVRLALRRPLSVAVMALLMMVLGALSFTLMNVDIFPAINLPVVMVVWSYPGLSAIDMERRMVIISERAFSTTVDGIEHMESESILGVGLIKVYFQPGTDIGAAIAQISGVSETILRQCPQGTTPPNIISYNAANVPVAQLNIYSDTLSQQQLFDYGLNFIRLQLFTIPGFSSPAPIGGVQRAVVANLDPQRLYANSLSPVDIGNALASSNVVIPSGTARMGNYEYDVDLNYSPAKVSEFNHLPLKVVNGIPVFLGDVAPVSDTHQPQTNVVRIDGRPATYLLVIKHAAASTLSVVNAVRARIPEILAVAPKGLKAKLTFDQSVFVRSALWEVVRESAMAAGLVALMVLVFTGSPRSMLIVITSIPLSILTSIVGLKLAGETINTMTLGGVALAVGMLVDDATVEIENIHRNHAMHKPLLVAILDGASQIATPTLVGTLSICIVFFPVVLMKGVERFLFTPLALAVVFAMLTSYLLSRTLVPTMASYLLPEWHEESTQENRWGRFLRRFEAGFQHVRTAYAATLSIFITHRGLSLIVVALVIAGSAPLLWVVGEDFFPTVDAGLLKLHIRAPSGTRIERTAWLVDNIERSIRNIIPADELDQISDDLDLPQPYAIAFFPSDNIGPQDAEIMIQLRPRHHPSALYQQRIREMLSISFPNVEGYFMAADIVNQVLNFGLPSAIDAQISGNDLHSDYRYAVRLASRMSVIAGITDLHIAEPLDYPAFKVDVDRAKALELGITEQQVASALLSSLSGNTLISPNYWLDPKNGVNYNVVTQTPIQLTQSIDQLANTPLTNGSNSQSTALPQAVVLAQSDSSAFTNGTATTAVSGPSVQVLGNVASIHHSLDPAVIAHYTVQRVIDVDCGVDGRDLGTTTNAVQRAIDSLGKLPAGTRITIRGQSQAMRQSFVTMGAGLILAIVLVYLLMVANFQSWLEPFIIILAVPGAMAGVLWMLVLTGTTINVESLMGAIMAVGVGVANGNLLITFANELREEGRDSVQAAIEAGAIRFRPIIMTALAMILGMFPMALAIGSGSEMNAPLGRAVIGGLVAATLMTLFTVPAVYSIFSRTLVTKRERDARVDAIRTPGA